MPRRLFRRLMPDPSRIHQHGLLKWLGPALHHPRLWHVSRCGIALGAAIGIFFGVLLPVGQIPAAATVAILMRANLPISVVGTFITNPFTFAPVYYIAYRLGVLLMGGDSVIDPTAFDANAESLKEWLGFWFNSLRRIGLPLVTGLAVLACCSSVVSYFGIHWFWRFVTLRNWRKRAAARKAGLAAHG